MDNKTRPIKVTINTIHNQRQNGFLAQLIVFDNIFFKQDLSMISSFTCFSTDHTKFFHLSRDRSYQVTPLHVVWSSPGDNIVSGRHRQLARIISQNDTCHINRQTDGQHFRTHLRGKRYRKALTSSIVYGHTNRAG